MTQKDYNKIAEVLREVKKCLSEENSTTLFLQFSFMLKEDNPRFDERKFSKAVYQI
ncbi:hypothetical protein LCGC14_2841750 [marine sediment metagenome]|uniref:Uncharacterized protein n=1 Tax=marine sediment metagenome TaxID=412755 RepID=A0A0F8YB53_9ZZZZ